MKSKINEMYAQGLLTAGGIANAIASGWITDADAVSILGEEDGLAAAKTARIAQSKAALAAYLEASGRTARTMPLLRTSSSSSRARSWRRPWHRPSRPTTA